MPVEQVDLPWADPSDKNAHYFWGVTPAEPAEISGRAARCPHPDSSERNLSSQYPPFKHNPIDCKNGDLRLIRLRPRTSSEARVGCNMATHSIPPRHATLSYTWESSNESSKPGDILINGQHFTVTGNLYEFLCCQSRDEEFCRNELLWIDQLCINQEDSDEISVTVGRMREIYSSAERTIVWLSADNDVDGANLNWAMQMIKDAPTTVKRLERESEVLESSQFREQAIKVLEGLPSKVSRHLLPIPYWGRIWIVQEIVMSNHITLKSEKVEIEWEKLEHFFDLCSAYKENLHALRNQLKEQPSTLDSMDSRKIHIYAWAAKMPNPTPITALIAIRRRWYSRRRMGDCSPGSSTNGTPSFLTWKDIIPFTFARACKIPRDRIFGALGLVTPLVAVNVDYNCDSELVWRNVLLAETNISQSRKLGDSTYCCSLAAYYELSRDLQRALHIWTDLETHITKPKALLHLVHEEIRSPCSTAGCPAAILRYDFE